MIKTSVRFLPDDSAAQTAEKLNKVLLEIQRQGGGTTVKAVSAGGSSGGTSTSTTTIIETSSLARHFLLMGA